MSLIMVLIMMNYEDYYVVVGPYKTLYIKYMQM